VIRDVLIMSTLMAFAVPADAQNFPIWERILKHYSAPTDDTPVPSMKMGHMQMTLKGETKSWDAAQAAQILTAASAVLTQYRDVKTAMHDGYRPFFPSGRMGEEIHYTNYRYRHLEEKQVDYIRPSSILYKRTAQGLQAIGVMYTAPASATAEQLDAIAPLSLATWHRHIDFCGGPKSSPAAERSGPTARFGPQGSIHTEEDCLAAHGLWIPLVLNWMTHVYPNEPVKWGGMDMEAEASEPGGGD
jgi:hypothetical protein